MLVLIDTNVILDMLEKREPLFFIFSGKIIPLKSAGVYFWEF